MKGNEIYSEAHDGTAMARTVVTLNVEARQVVAGKESGVEGTTLRTEKLKETINIAVETETVENVETRRTAGTAEMAET